MDNSVRKAKWQITDLYNRVAADYGQVGPGFIDHFGLRLVQLTGVVAEACVLDIGTGRGASLLPAAQVTHSNGLAVGIDIAFQMVHQTWGVSQKKNMTGVRLLQMDGDYLAFRSGSFDFVLCGFAIFFFPNPAHTLREWYRILMSTGRLGICVATSSDERWQWYEELLFAYHKRYQFPLSAHSGGLRQPNEIKNKLEVVGFSQVEIKEENYEFAYKDENEWWQAKWTHGARFPLEQMSEIVMTQFKTEVFEQLQPAKAAHGLNEKWQLAYIVGVK